MHMATIDHTKTDLMSAAKLIAATCASEQAPTAGEPRLRRFALKLKQWFTTNRGYYSERERQRFLADQAVQRAHYRMRSFY